jgi:hypothetical protein
MAAPSAHSPQAKAQAIAISSEIAKSFNSCALNYSDMAQKQLDMR